MHFTYLSSLLKILWKRSDVFLKIKYFKINMKTSRCPNIDHFCFICGHIVTKRVKPLSSDLKLAYTSYFDEMEPSREDYTPNISCGNCYNRLLDWYHRRGRHLSFIKPMVWIRDPNGHDESRCYACINFVPKLHKKSLKTKIYVESATGILPQHMPDWVEPPKRASPDAVTTTTAAIAFTIQNDDQDNDYYPETTEDGRPKPLTQREMDYLVAKMGLSQRNSELLTTFLKRRKLSRCDVKATSYRNRQIEFQKYYTVNTMNTFTHCIDIEGLVNHLGMAYVADDWRLFIDGSVSSLKVVLLHKTNNKPSIPLAYGTNLKETHESLGNILKNIKYEQHKWKICCDLKVINIMQGIISKGGFPNYFCFLCDWDSRYQGNQYECSTWKARDAHNIKRLKLKNKPLIKDTRDILLPPLHIKLGIASKFVKTAVESSEEIFDCLKSIFPKLSDTKIKAGVLTGPDIRKLMKSTNFCTVLSGNRVPESMGFS